VARTERDPAAAAQAEPSQPTVTVARALSWEPLSPVPARDAERLLSEGLVVTFSAPLAAESVADVASELVTCLYLPRRPGMTAIPLFGTAAVDGVRLIWSADPASFSALREASGLPEGRVVVDIACDHLLDENMRPVAGSIAVLRNGPGPAVPGGLLRTWVNVSG
jgi:hypothetical protein